MTRVGNIGLFEVREPAVELLVPVAEEGVRVGAEDGQDGAADPACALVVESPATKGGNVDTKEGVGICDRFSHTAGDPLLDDGLALLPRPPGDHGEEAGHCLCFVAGAVGGKGRADLVVEVGS